MTAVPMFQGHRLPDRAWRVQVITHRLLAPCDVMGPAVYLDYNATTPVDPRVLEQMLPFFTEHYGNPSSDGHAYGWAAAAAADTARSQVADALGTRPANIIFTSGASEGISTIIKGVARYTAARGRRHIVTVRTEHKAVLNSCRAVERLGCRVTYLPVDADGLFPLEALEAALTDDTVLVCVMRANNETGVLQPIREIAGIVRPRSILLMTDATQAVGKLPVTVEGVDFMVCSAHKFYGPKGVGALYVRERVRLPALVDGGGQERGRRGGTLNVPGIVGLGEAIRLACEEVGSEHARQQRLRDSLEQMLRDALPGVRFNGSRAPRLPNTSSVTFSQPECEQLFTGALGTVALSRGSACVTASSSTSHVLRAMGVQPDQARRTARISLGRFTTADHLRRAAETLIGAVQSLIQTR